MNVLSLWTSSPMTWSEPGRVTNATASLKSREMGKRARSTRDAVRSLKLRPSWPSAKPMKASAIDGLAVASS